MVTQAFCMKQKQDSINELFFCRITSIHWQAQSIQEINGKKIKMDNFVKKSSVFYNKSLDEIYI